MSGYSFSSSQEEITKTQYCPVCRKMSYQYVVNKDIAIVRTQSDFAPFCTKLCRDIQYRQSVDVITNIRKKISPQFLSFNMYTGTYSRSFTKYLETLDLVQ